MNRPRKRRNASQIVLSFSVLAACGSIVSAALTSSPLLAGVVGGFATTAFLEGAIAPQPVQAQSASRNPEIKVGIVQRFGAKKDDQLALAPLAGDQLTVSFMTGGEVQTISTNRLQIGIDMQPLPEPILQEWVVLSTHRSFESAEDSAKRWQAAGIDAEIAQPEAWQVWAKRETYSTPLVRRLLLQNIHAEGYTNAYIDSQIVKEIPKVFFAADGYKYGRDAFNISTSNRRIQMATGNSTRYRDLFAGDMKIQPNAYGNYTLVNQVPIEQYLRGVVPHEIGASAPRQAIEAQAVLARTYALRNLRRFAIDDYEICADTQCQVYFGIAETYPDVDAAIAATAGQVLTYQNELVDALYSSTTGGITSRFTDVWNGEDRPYLTPVIDSLQTQWDLEARPLSNEDNFRAFIALKDGFNEDGWPAFRWNRAASLKEIGNTMKEYLTKRQHPLADFKEITALTITERAPSGRVQKLRVDTDLGSFDLIKDESVKALVPPRSLLFYLEPIYEIPKTASAPNAAIASSKTVLAEQKRSNQKVPQNIIQAAEQAKQAESNSAPAVPAQPSPTESVPETPVLTGYRFIGGGFGHGVGMSQTGAYNLGKRGYSYSQILSFYYPGTQLQPISESTIFYVD